MDGDFAMKKLTMLWGMMTILFVMLLVSCGGEKKTIPAPPLDELRELVREHWENRIKSENKDGIGAVYDVRLKREGQSTTPYEFKGEGDIMLVREGDEYNDFEDFTIENTETIEVTYDGKLVTYQPVYDDHVTPIYEIVLERGNVLYALPPDTTTSRAETRRRSVTSPPAEELIKVIEDDFNQILRRKYSSAKVVVKSITLEPEGNNVEFPFEYQGEIIDNYNSAFDLIASYYGSTVGYEALIPGMSGLAYVRTVKLKRGDILYIDTTPKGVEALTLTYPDGTVDELYRFSLSRNALKALKTIYDADLTAKNIYIPKDAYDGWFYSLINTTEYRSLFESRQSKRTESIYKLFDTLSVDSFSEEYYPISDRNSETKFHNDMAASMYIVELVNATETFYQSLTDLTPEMREQRTRRLSANLDSANKDLFKIIFPELLSRKSVDFKGFYIE